MIGQRPIMGEQRPAMKRMRNARVRPAALKRARTAAGMQYVSTNEVGAAMKPAQRASASR